MNKKISELLVCFLSVVCMASALGCADKKQMPADQEPKASTVLLNGFEDWAPDFQLCRISKNFGKISINSDPQYVKTGLRSARIDPLHVGWMYIPTYSEVFEYDYTDFTYTDTVKTTIYNPQPSDETIRIGLVAKINTTENIDRIAEEEFKLSPGWNTIEYIVDPIIISLMGDITDVQGVYYAFEPALAASADENTPRYYLDSVVLVNVSAPHTQDAQSAGFTFGENTVIDFERFYDKYFFINDMDVTLEIVKAADFGINASSGSKALHLIIPGTNTGSWNYYLKFAAPLLNLSALGKLSQKDFDRAYLSWDVYNAYSSAYNIVGIFQTGSGAKDYRVNSSPKPYQWTTFSVKLLDIEENNPGWKDNKGQFVFSIKDNFDEPRELFFDNFRVEIK